jgi:LysM repeat protein
VRSGILEFTKQQRERQVHRRLPEKAADATIREMKSLLLGALALLLAEFTVAPANAQTASRPPADGVTAAQLQALTKKIDEQNAKIDTLSQQILKLEQQISNTRPGVMIGEATPAPAAPRPPVETAPRASAGNTHTVAPRETLTSIAKMHNVTVSELEKVNHIENDRKLQIGQTLVLPSSATSSSSPGD